MSYPPRPPMGGPRMWGAPPGMGMPPPQVPVGLPPPPLPGPGYGYGRPGHFNTSLPPPRIRRDRDMEDKPSDHPLPYPTPTGPPVTVFVGNITEKWPDPMIRQLLATCGQVISWKRVQGASGKLQGFGFCEFSGPDAGLRAVRLLHELEVGDKKLVVKVDAKTQTLLDEFKAERRKNSVDESGEADEKKNGDSSGDKKPTESDGDMDYMDAEMKDWDERAKQRIEIIFTEYKNEFEPYAADKAKPEQPEVSKEQIKSKLHLLKLSSIDATLAGAAAGTLPEEPDLPEEIAQDEGKREIITREISIFRENMKQEQEREEERKRMERERREREREREEKRKREREKGTEDITSPDHMSGGRDRNQKGHSRERGFGGFGRDNRRRDQRDGYGRDRPNDRRRGRSRERRSRSIERIPRSPGGTGPGGKTRLREREEEEEQNDQKKLEKKAREKEAAYEKRLREWEVRESQKSREYKKVKEKLKRQEEELQRESKKMKQFFEDYNDEQHDPKYYKGKELQKRLGDRAKELEDDNKDRQREREELEEMKLRMMTSSSKSTPTTNPLNSASLLEKAQQQTPSLFAGLKMELKPSISSRLQALASIQPASAPINSNHVSEKKEPLLTPLSNPTTPTLTVLMSPAVPAQPLQSPASVTKPPPIISQSPFNKSGEDDSRQSYSPGGPSPRMALPSPIKEGDDSSKSPLDAPRRKKVDVKDVFNQDEDDTDGFGNARKRKLVPLDFGDESKKPKKEEKANAEEKKKNIKALIDKIPTEKDALFAYEVDWEMVDTTLMEKRIRPWINKKIVEYIGEPEPTLVDFICSKVLGRSAPRSILEDVLMVLDEEAEVFVVKMWRLLVYEIEAKKYGIATSKSQ